MRRDTVTGPGGAAHQAAEAIKERAKLARKRSLDLIRRNNDRQNLPDVGAMCCG